MKTANDGPVRRIAVVSKFIIEYERAIQKQNFYFLIINNNNFFFFAEDKELKEKEKAAQSLAVPRLSVCADAQKVDRAKLAQTEVSKYSFNIKIKIK